MMACLFINEVQNLRCGGAVAFTMYDCFCDWPCILAMHLAHGHRFVLLTIVHADLIAQE